MRKTVVRAVFALIAAAAAVGPGIAAQMPQRIGVSGAVNPDVVGTPPGAPTRRLVVGQEIVHNEHIVTSAGGQTQILFIDGSAMTIGPNSDLTIDEFVYDPDTSKGRLSMSATRGVLRFVGGELSKNENAVSLRTPSATIGIRGGIFLAKLGPRGQLDVTFVYGKGLTVTGLCGAAVPSGGCGGTETVTRPGFSVSVAGIGAMPSRPAPAPANSVNTILAQLNGKAGDTGGSTNPPTDASVASSGISSIASANVQASAQAAAQNSGVTPAPAPTTGEYATSSSNLEISSVGTQGAPGIMEAYQSPPAPGSPLPGVVVSLAGSAKATAGSAGRAGFIDPSVMVPFTQAAFSYPAGATLQNGTFTATDGTTTLITLSPLTPGTTTEVSGQTSFGGPVTGTATMTADGNFFYADLVSTGSASNGQREFVFAGVPVSQSFYAPTPTQQFYAFTVQPDGALASASQAQTVPFLPSNLGGATANATVSPLYLVTPANTQFAATNQDALNTPAPRWLQASLAIDGQGAGQSAALVVGLGSFFTANDGTVSGTGPVRGTVLSGAARTPVYVRSNASTVADGLGNTLFGGNTVSGFVLDSNIYDSNFMRAPGTATATTLNAGSNASSAFAFNQPVTATALPVNVGASRSALNESGWFGGIMQCCTSNSSFVLNGRLTALQTDPASSRMAAQFVGSDPFTTQPSGVSQIVMNFGGLPPTVGLSHSTYIDNNLFGSAENLFVPALVVTQGTAVPSGAALAMVSSGVVPNTALLPPGVGYCDCQYLQWGYWTGQITPAGAGATNPPFNAGAAINTWVAGTPTVTMPTSGIGAFTGAAVGTVFNNGATYLAAGGFTNSYNFGTNSGTLTISDFDNNTFVGTVNGVGGGPNYAGGLIGANAKGVATGTFYGPSAQETGGTFSVQGVAGPSYLASGIFAGKR